MLQITILYAIVLPVDFILEAVSLGPSHVDCQWNLFIASTAPLGASQTREDAIQEHIFLIFCYLTASYNFVDVELFLCKSTHMDRLGKLFFICTNLQTCIFVNKLHYTVSEIIALFQSFLVSFVSCLATNVSSL